MPNDNIHLHQFKPRPSWYFFALLVPSLVFAFTLSVLATQRNPNKAAQVQGESSIPLTIKDKTIQAIKANTPEKTQKGLSGRSPLAENEGMIFIFPEKDINARFWMKDMKFDIDIIWIDDNKVVDITYAAKAPEEGTPTSKLPLYIPKQKVDYVLEVNSGFVVANNIREGDIVNFTP